MSDTINLTIDEIIEVTNLTITEEGPIYVNFYDVALPDPRVVEALNAALAAQGAAEDAEQSALDAQTAAEQAALNAAAAVDAGSQSTIINALIFG